MAIKISQLIKVLQKKEQSEEVEFIVVSTKGSLICMDMEATAPDTMKVLGLFAKPKPKEEKLTKK